MKAIFNKLKPKEAVDGEGSTKETTANSRGRRFVAGFGSLSRATGNKVLHQRQSSDYHPDGSERSDSTTGSLPRRPLSTLSRATNSTPIYDRSASVSTSSRGSRLASPIDLAAGSSTGESSETGPHNVGRTPDAMPARATTPFGEYSKPLPPRPKSGTSDAFGVPMRNAPTARPLSSKDIITSQRAQTPDRLIPGKRQSVSANLFHRRVSASSNLGIKVESQPSSIAVSPVSTRSQQSLAASGEKEYCKSRQSWTGMTDVDLVANLSVQERTRQEVLFEIVSSEERCVS